MIGQHRLYCANASVLMLGAYIRYNESRRCNDPNIYLYESGSHVPQGRSEFKCSISVRNPKFHVFRANADTIEKSVSIDQGFPGSTALFSRFSKDSVLISIGFDGSSEYYISHRNISPSRGYIEILPKEFPYYDIIKDTTISFQVYSAEKYVPSEICRANVPIHKPHLLLIAFFIIIAIRMVLMRRSSSSASKHGPFLWYSCSNGALLSRIPINFEFNLQTLSNKFQKFIIDTNSDGKSEIIGAKKNSHSTKLSHLHVYRISKDIFLNIFWVEDIEDIKIDCSSSVDGSTFTIDDNDIVFSPQISISTSAKNQTTAVVPLVIDNNNCTLSISSSSNLPFGMSAVSLAMLDVLQLNCIFRQLLLCLSENELHGQMDDIFEKFGLTYMAIYSINGSALSKLCERFTEPINGSDLKEMVGESQSNSLQYSVKTINHNRYVSCGFRFQSEHYAVITSMDASLMIYRAIEIQFHFSISMILIFSHWMKNSWPRTFPFFRLLSIFKMPSFLLIECKEDPSRISKVHGSFHGLDVDQNIIDKFISKLDRKNYKEIVGLRSSTQYKEIVIQTDSMALMIIFNPFIDKYLGKTLYLYFVEDVTNFHSASFEIRKKFSYVNECAKVLDIFDSPKDFSSLSERLEVKTPSVLPQDLKLLSKSGNEPIAIRFISKTGCPKWFCLIRSPEKLYIFDLSFFKFCKFAKRPIRSEDNPIYLIGLINQERVIPIIISEGMEQFSSIKGIEDFSLILKSRFSNFKGLPLDNVPMILVGQHEYFYLFVTGKVNGMQILTITDANDKLPIRLMNSRVQDLVEYGVGSSSMTSWVMEDAKEPERSFETKLKSSSRQIINWSSLVGKNFLNEEIITTFQNALESQRFFSKIVDMSSGERLLFCGEVSKESNLLTGVAIDVTEESNGRKDAVRRISELQMDDERLQVELEKLSEEISNYYQLVTELLLSFEGEEEKLAPIGLFDDINAGLRSLDGWF